ncbi:unnamed protein product [Rhizophagus irregularis]|nr:unnamed protein product [Rhizophagus irregularis]CAB4439441.1 unnamed protein product [Rhizophagus irregularis]
MEGIGAPVKRIGLVKSQFRPSDDSTTFPFLIPSNAFASVELSHLYEMIDTTSPDIAKKAKNLSQIIRDSIYSNAIIPHKHFENIFAYEIDGYGSSNLMDDANLPSLLSLPYFGFIDNDDKIYLKTRDFVMSLCMKILTSTNDQEILETLELLKESSADTGLMHESFYYNDPNNYTRSWFAWANSLFGETILHLAKEKPDLIMIDDFKFIKLLDASK